MKTFLKDAWDLLGTWIVCGAIVGTLMTLYLTGKERERRAEELRLINQVYPAWTKLHPDKSLSYDEWRALYRRNTLPR